MTCMNNNHGNEGSNDPSSWFPPLYPSSPRGDDEQFPLPEQVPFPPTPSQDPRITGQVATEGGEMSYILMDRIRVGLDHQSNVAIIQMERDDQSYANLVLLNTKGLVYLIYNLRMILQDMERMYGYIPPTPQI